MKEEDSKGIDSAFNDLAKSLAPKVEAPAKKTAKAFTCRIPGMWNITHGEGTDIIAVCGRSQEKFEGSRADFNKRMAK